MTETSDRFDFAELFDEDYRHFYDTLADAEISDIDTELIAALLQLQPADRVLDIACGYGRIANRLAADHQVTGLDQSPQQIAMARRDAGATNVTSQFVRGDMRCLPFASASFDAALCWFTSLGYFADDQIRANLAEAARVLAPGGRLLVEGLNVHQVVRDFQANFVVEHEQDLLIDHNRFDAVQGRTYHERLILRDGARRELEFFVRHPTFPELAAWLLAAGFDHVEAYGGEGEAFDVDSSRLIAVGWRTEAAAPAAPTQEQCR